MKKREFRLKGVAACLIVSLAASVVAWFGASLFESWEFIFLDWHLRETAAPDNDQKIVLVLGGDRSMAELDSWPWPRELHAQLIEERLSTAKVIAYDVFLVDKTSEEQDDALARAISGHGNMVLGNAYRSDGVLLQPLEKFRENAATGYFNFFPDGDHVMRRYPLAMRSDRDGYSVHIPSFLLSVLEAAGFDPLIDGSNRLYLSGADGPLQLDRELSVFKLPVGGSAYEIYEFSDVLNGKVSADAFTDAVVFVGISATGASDIVHTPTGYSAGTHTLADVYYSLLSGYAPQQPHPAIQILSVFLILAACLICASLLPNQLNWLPVVLTASLMIPTAHLLFRYAGIYLPTAAACFVLVLCGVFQLFFLRMLRENRQKQAMLMNMVTCMVSAIDAKDPITAGHSQRVSEVSARIAMKKGLKRKEVETIRLAGLIHDIGKIGVPDTVLNKPGRFTPDEFQAMQQHPEKGLRIMERAGLPDLVISGIRDHHERLDGKGYPLGKAGEELTLSAQIIKIADVYDALVSKRQYKEPWPIEKVCDALYQGRHTEFNAELIDLFLEEIRPQQWSPPASADEEQP